MGNINGRMELCIKEISNKDIGMVMGSGNLLMQSNNIKDIISLIESMGMAYIVMKMGEYIRAII